MPDTENGSLAAFPTALPALPFPRPGSVGAWSENGMGLLVSASRAPSPLATAPGSEEAGPRSGRLPRPPT